MMGMVANLSEADMKGLAAFYGGQKLKPAAASRQEPRGGSASASGAAAMPPAAYPPAPAATGQPAPECRRSTRASPGSTPNTSPPSSRPSRRAARANDPNGMMRGVAARLTDREIRAVAEYAAGLR